MVVSIDEQKLPVSLSRPYIRPYKRVLLVDGPNLYFALKSEGRKLDFEKLKRSLLPEGGLAVYFTFLPRRRREHESFLEVLRRQGWEVVLSPSPSRWGKEKGVDITLGLTLVELAPHAEEIYLVSGDGDLIPAVRKARSLGTKVFVASPQGVLSQALVREADGVELL